MAKNPKKQKKALESHLNLLKSKPAYVVLSLDTLFSEVDSPYAISKFFGTYDEALEFIRTDDTLDNNATLFIAKPQAAVQIHSVTTTDVSEFALED